MLSVIKNVNKVYNEKNPSIYLKDLRKIRVLLENKKHFLLEMKLTKKLFLNSNLIDLGSGSGQNTLGYDNLGSKCTLVEYDKKSYEYSKNLFLKYAKNKFRVINSNIFDLNLNEKFDFVISNGVFHHTHNIKKGIKTACKLLKKDGFFILGIANTFGFFQRNLQRFILYKLSHNKEEIIKNAIYLFNNHLNRARKFGGRTKEQIIFDSYINPKIEAITLEEITKIFKSYNLLLYSSYNGTKNLQNILLPNSNQFKGIGKIKKKNYKPIYISELQNFSLSNNKLVKSDMDHFIKLNNLYKSISKYFNDCSPNNFYINEKKAIKNIKLLNQNLNVKSKIDVININHNKTFLKELELLLKILNKKNLNNKTKLIKVRNLLKKSKKILKGLNGCGMNYYVGYKEK